MDIWPDKAEPREMLDSGSCPGYGMICLYRASMPCQSLHQPPKNVALEDFLFRVTASRRDYVKRTMDMAAILNTLIGALLAILTTITVEWFRKPALRLHIAQPHDNDYSSRPGSPAQKARFLYLSVHNLSLPYLLKWMSRNPATDVWGIISYHHIDDGQDVFGRSMAVRWSGSTEPPRAATGGVVMDSEWLRSIHRRDIQSGEEEPIDVAARFDDDRLCYFWSNENYFSNPQWRNTRWELGPGRYIVRVEIRSSGQKFVDCFRLCNEGTRDSFRLEPANPGDEKKIQARIT
jgi:hypothetical protein